MPTLQVPFHPANYNVPERGFWLPLNSPTKNATRSRFRRLRHRSMLRGRCICKQTITRPSCAIIVAYCVVSRGTVVD